MNIPSLNCLYIFWFDVPWNMLWFDSLWARGQQRLCRVSFSSKSIQHLFQSSIMQPNGSMRELHGMLDGGLRAARDGVRRQHDCWDEKVSVLRNSTIPERHPNGTS